MKYIMLTVFLTILGACSTTDSRMSEFQEKVKDSTFVWSRPGSSMNVEFIFDQQGNLSFPVGPQTHTFNYESTDSNNTNKAYYVSPNMMGLGKVYAGLELGSDSLKVYYGTGRQNDPITKTKESITWVNSQLKHTAIKK